jgi:phosphatidylglycerophosphatase A
MKDLRIKIAEISAVGFGLGLAPRAPGTFGSLGGLLAGFVINAGAGMLFPAGTTLWYTSVALLLCALTAFAWWSIAVAEKAWGSHDEGKIVVDEIAGQAIAVAFFPPGLICYAAGFLFFRLFDIWKPGPIGAADRDLEGAAGTLVDDLMAGAVAGLCTAALLWAESLVFPA